SGSLAARKRVELHEHREVANLQAEIEAVVRRVGDLCAGDERLRYRVGALQYYIDTHPDRSVDSLLTVLALAEEAERCPSWSERVVALERLMDALAPSSEAR
ncbi:MAG: hypothetical protein AAFP86_21400, partial [Planctomycetota bacterium]